MHIAEQFPDSHLILGGDFNVDFARRDLHTEFLENFCSDNNLCLAVNHMSSTVDYTYNFCMQRFSVLDHFVVSSVFFDSCISSVVVLLTTHITSACSDSVCLIILLYRLLFLTLVSPAS